MIIDRLVYGCARLTGGASAASSRRLVEACLATGVRHFDTAPAYGMGTAEAVLGSAVAGRPDVRITAKVGSTRPRGAMLGTWARAGKAMVRPRASPLRDGFSPMASASRRAGAAMSPHDMARSLDVSRAALGRDRFDVLLLHDVAVCDMDERRIALLTDARGLGLADAVGWSTGAMLDPAIVDRVPADWVGQAALAPETLVEGPRGVEPDFLHSIANTARFCTRTDAVFASRLIAVAALIPDGVADRRTALIAAAFARLHALMPERRLIFASIDPGRLAAFLAAIDHLDRHVGDEPFRFGALST